MDYFRLNGCRNTLLCERSKGQAQLGSDGGGKKIIRSEAMMERMGEEDNCRKGDY